MRSRSARLTPANGQPLPRNISDLHQASVVLDRILVTNLLPFWRSKVGGEHAFGYLIVNPEAPEQADKSLRGIVTQARTLWFFARIMQSPFATAADRFQADRGFAFLAEHLWDHRHGGFYWHIDLLGRPVRAGKELYGHAFALFALSRYAAASGTARAAELAHATFDILEQRFHDRDYPGYHECFTVDWRPPTPSERSRKHIAAGCKTYNSHLHMLEAITEYLPIADTSLVRRRLEELCTVLTGPVVRRPYFTACDMHFQDWRPAFPPEREQTSYGHDLENIHLLMAARKILAKDDGELLPFYRGLFDNALRFGEDRADGGFFHTGPVGQPAGDLRKIWWVQAEALLAAIEMFRLTSEVRFADCFNRVLSWIANRQVDWREGEWFAEVTPDGRITGEKVGLWKGPYHTSRAILHSLEILRSLSSR